MLDIYSLCLAFSDEYGYHGGIMAVVAGDDGELVANGPSFSPCIYGSSINKQHTRSPYPSSSINLM